LGRPQEHFFELAIDGAEHFEACGVIDHFGRRAGDEQELGGFHLVPVVSGFFIASIEAGGEAHDD